MPSAEEQYDQSRVPLKYLDFICPREGAQRHLQKFDLAGFVSLKQVVTIVDGYQYVDKNGTLRGSFSDVLYWLAQELHHIASKVKQLRFSNQQKGQLAPFSILADGSVEHKFWRSTASLTFRDYQLVKLVYDQCYQEALDHYIESFASHRFMANNKPYPPGRIPADFEAWVDQQVEFGKPVWQ